MKRGISLIAVLMFMLAATTASVVLFRWIGEENFASGSRLKASEAYQASEAGLDAAYSWLSFKAADAGALLSDYLKDKAPRGERLLNSVLGGQTLGTGNAGERFDVYLIGADTVSKPYKLKILSVGKGRDNSQVSQTAIFKVDGLYTLRTSISTTPSNGKTTANYNEDFWGNMGTFDKIEVSSAIMTQTAASKNLGGQALNSVKVGTVAKSGYLVLDGDFYANNGMNIYGDLYTTGAFDICGSNNDYITGDVYIGGTFHNRVSTGTFKIDGSAYFADSVTPNVNPKIEQCNGFVGGNVQIDGNTTIRGPYEYNDGCSRQQIINWSNNVPVDTTYSTSCGGGGQDAFYINGNLVMDNVSYIDLINAYAANTATSQFEVKKSVAIKKFNPDNPNLNYYPNKTSSNNNIDSKRWPWFGKESGFDLCISQTVSEVREENLEYYNTNNPLCTGSGCKVYEYGSFPNSFYFKTNASNVNNCPSNYINEWGADPMDGKKTDKNYKSKLSGYSDVKSCETANAPIVFDQTIHIKAQNINPASWVHREDKPGSCAKINNTSMKLAVPSQWVNLGTELQDCWNAIQNSQDPNAELYDDKWLVVYIKDKVNWNHDKLNNPISSGNYIIILEAPDAFSRSNYFYLPSTKAGVQVMLYLPNGYASSGILLEENHEKIDDYNYFIFSDGNIGEFDTKSGKLHGNVFMNDCSVMNSLNTMTSFRSEGNNDFIQELIDSKVIQDNPDYKGATAPPEEGDIKELQVHDSHIIPIGNRLKVELESKSISKDKITSTSVKSNAAASSILVMPRIIFLPTDALTGTRELSDYYTLLYLNGAKESDKPSSPATCSNDNVSSEEKPTETGVYTCEFSGSGSVKISEFYVQISGKSKDPTISLSADKINLESGECAQVSINVENGANDANVSYSASVSNSAPSSGWSITPGTNTSGTNPITATIQSSKSSEPAYKVCLNDITATSSVTVYFTGACSVSGGTGSCTINNDKQMVTISKKKEKSAVYLKDLDPNSDVLDCYPKSWGLSGGDCNAITVTAEYKNGWECEVGSNVTLTHSEQNGCTYTQGTLTSLTVSSDNNANILEASHKLKHYKLTVNKPNEVSLTFTARNPHGGNDLVKTCGCSNIDTLYHGLTYTISGVSNRRVLLNNVAIPSPYEIKVESSGNVLTIEENNIDVCVFEDNNNLCPGIPLKDIITNKPLPSTSQDDDKCYFFSNVSNVSVTGSGSTDNVKINGESSSADLSSLYTKDGGLYVYVPIGYVFTAEVSHANLSEKCIEECGSECQSSSGGWGCQYQASWCGNIELSNVVTASQNGDQNGPKCVYATTITQMGNQSGGSLTVNGININPTDYGRCGRSDWSQPTCQTALDNAGVQKVDGGYYIYIPGWAGQSFQTTGGELNCNLSGGGGSGNSGVSSSSAPSSSSAAGGGGGGSGGTVAINDGTAKNIGTGSVTITCESQSQIVCWSDPSKEVNIGCVNIGSWANANNGTSFSCGGNGQGGSVNCNVPAGENIYCKKQ